MARKNIFQSVMQTEEAEEKSVSPVENVSRCFGVAMFIPASIDEHAKQASQKLDGEETLELDRDGPDAALSADRLPEEDD